MYIQASEIKSEFHTDSEGQKLLNLISNLGWDYDRMSSSGQQVYDELFTLIGGQTHDRL